MNATVDADRALVEHAELDVQYCSIRSPIDGRIGQILIHEGNVVKANETQLAVIHQTRPVRVSFAVPQQDLPEVREQMAHHDLTVDAILPGHETKPITGSLAFVDNAIDESLWPGVFVSVRLTLSIRKDVLTVPARAVQTGQKGPYVFVVGKNDAVENRPIETGFAVGTATVVERGLEPGERVVTDGQIRLAPGVPVRIVSFGPEKTPATGAAEQAS
jgi:multidrug efflux system membrane fusion protein